MKKLILVLAVLAGLSVNAQQKEWRRSGQPYKERSEVQRLTPEQRTALQVKKMALALDLNDAQQKQVEKLMLERSNSRQAAVAKIKANREAGKKLTAEERYAMKSERLDGQIAMKREMKKILDAGQYEKFNEMLETRKNNTRKHFRKKHLNKRK